MHRWMPCWGYFRRRYLQNRSGQMHWMRSMFGCLPYRGHLIGRIITGRKDIGFIRGAVSKWQILAQPLRRVWMACPLFYVCFLYFMRSCLKFFLRTFEAGFRAGFCHFLRRIAALFYNKNGGNMPEWCHKELLKKIKQLLNQGLCKTEFAGAPGLNSRCCNLVIMCEL